MVQHRKFGDLALDDGGLHTPDGTLTLARISRAEVIRNRSREGASGRDSGPGAVGGALVGGALAGPGGFLAGGLVGAAGEGEGGANVPRTVSATVVFESPELAYTTTVGRDHVAEAEESVAAVKREAGLRA